MEIHLITIRRMGELQKEKAEVEREKTKLEEEKQQKEKEIQILKEENSALKKKVEDLEVNVESAKQFSVEKPKQILVCGDSHLKCISLDKISQVTGTKIEFAKTYCSRDDWCPTQESRLQSNQSPDNFSHL